MNSNDDKNIEIDISQYLDILLRRRWIVLALATITLAVTALVTYTTEPVYRSGVLLVIEKESGGTRISGDTTMVENTQEDYYQTQFKLFQSYTLLEKVWNDLELAKTRDFGGGVDALNGAITVSPVRRSRLVNIYVDSHEAELTSKIANRLAETFVKQNLSNQLFISQDILRTLQANPDTSLGREAYESLPAVVNDQLIRSLKLDLVRLESKYADLSGRYTKKHPLVMSLTSNIDVLKQRIRLETDKVVQSLKTELSGQLKGNNVRIVDKARTPGGPYKPRKFRSMVLGLMGGLFLGVLGALIIEQLDQSIRTQEDVQDRLRAPFLGHTPYLPLDPKEPVYGALASPKLSLTSEAFRNMRTMVDLSVAGGDADMFLVTSSVQEEGKSYVSTNLAVAFAQLGGKVLLIDGDMRRPNLHKNFRLTTQHGISEFLSSGKDVSEIEPLIQNSQISNLKVLVCGPKPPNPSELLNTPRVGALLDWAKTRFDRVIIDCPPMFPINDTLLWGQHVKTAVFVVRYGKTRVPLIQNAQKSLSEGKIKLLGVAINAATTGGLAYATYGHYYQQYYHTYAQAPETSKTT